MEKEKLLTKMTDAGLVAVVRANSADDAIRIADATKRFLFWFKSTACTILRPLTAINP